MNAQTTDATADSGDITTAELLPFLSFRDLRRRAFLWPGVTTAVFCIALLILGGMKDQQAFFWCLAIFISMANIYMVYLWCGKKMPFPFVLLITLLALVLDNLLVPAIVAAEKALPQLIAPGVVEESVKALPVLVVLFLGRFLSHGRQRKYAVREPLDGIILAAASATAFAFLETMFVYVPQYGPIVSTPRLLVNIFGHIAYAAAFGYFIGLAALHHHNIRTVIVAVVFGFFLANLLHDLWDLVRYFPDTISILSPLHEVVVAVASFVILTSMILKAREISPEREFLWPYGAMLPYLSPEVAPMPPMPVLPGDLWLVVGKRRIRLGPGVSLTAADVPGLAAPRADGIVAEVWPHPTQPGLLILRNFSSAKWEAVLPDGAIQEVRPAQTIPLLPGTRLDFGGAAGAVLIAAHDPGDDPTPEAEQDF